jgi:hypothetical protein
MARNASRSALLTDRFRPGRRRSSNHRKEDHGEPGLDESAERFHRASRGDTLGAAAGADAEDEPAVGTCGLDAAADVAVQQQ